MTENNNNQFVRKTPSKTIKDVNGALSGFVIDIISVGASSKGDNFDETVRDKLRKHLSGAKYILTEQWCSRDKDSIFLNHSMLTSKNNFNFSELNPIVDNGKVLDFMIVDKPNGSQKWPDILVIFNGVGFPIEIKSAKTDNILWNSGIPRGDGLYIYNCYGKSKTTCFLGQDAISSEEIEFLVERSKMAESLNLKHPESKWSYYVRDMFNSNQTFFESDDLAKKIARSQLRVDALNKDISTALMGSYRTPAKKVKLDLEQKSLNAMKYEYDQKKNARISIETEALLFVSNLTWDPATQRTDFNLVSYINQDASFCKNKNKPNS